MSKMHDIGAFAVLCAAPVLARLTRTDGETYAESLRDIRGSGRNRPCFAPLAYP